MRLRVPSVVVALAFLAACSGGGTEPDDGASLGVTATLAPVTAPPAPAVSPAGTGVVVIGGSSSSFSVTECELTSAEGDAATLLRVTGAGTTANEVPFQVEVQRFAVDTDAAKTFTDTITYRDTARILQLQRFEVDGVVSDLRDPEAVSTLLRVRSDGVSAVGLAGPPGTGADIKEGMVGFALDASC